MTHYSTPYCGAPILHDPHGFIITNHNIAYTITCPGQKPTPHGGPQGVAGKQRIRVKDKKAGED